MKINSRYEIKSDELQYIVYETIHSDMTDKRTKHETRTEIAGYFTTLPGVVSFLLAHSVKETGLTDLETVIKAIETARGDMLKALATMSTKGKEAALLSSASLTEGGT